jgi:O-methyltransferase
VACDISSETTAIGERYWAAAGVRDRIDLRIGPAVETLDSLIEDKQADSFDFAFVDADKASLHRYYEQCLELLRPGGLLLVDNQFLFGRAFYPEPNNDDAVAVNSLTAKAFEDERVEPALLAIGDGLLLARKA